MKYHQGFFKPKNPHKYMGDPTNIIYRSSWELKLLMFLDHNPNVLKYSSEETIIPYISPLDNRPHRYFPDFRVKLRDKDGKVKTIICEVKPKKQTMPPVKKSRVTKAYMNEVKTWAINEAKWMAAREYCRKNDWEFMILTEDNLGIK